MTSGIKTNACINQKHTLIVVEFKGVGRKVSRGEQRKKDQKIAKNTEK